MAQFPYLALAKRGQTTFVNFYPHAEPRWHFGMHGNPDRESCDLDARTDASRLVLRITKKVPPTPKYEKLP